MDRVSSLQKRAQDLTQRLFQSLPHYLRVAYVFFKLADLQSRALGKTLGAVFVIKKVQGLPEIHGKPVETLPAHDANINAVMRLLPSDYLEHFGGKLRTALLGKFRSTDLVDEVISGWLVRFVVEGGWKHMEEGMTLAGAYNYVLTGLQRQALNVLKSRKRHPEDMSLQDSDDEGRVRVNPADPHAVEKVVHNTPAWKEPKVRRILEQKVHPDAPLFLELVYEGHPMKDIIGDPKGGIESMLPHLKSNPMSYYNWLKTYNPRILKVFEELGIADEGAF